LQTIVWFGCYDSKSARTGIVMVYRDVTKYLGDPSTKCRQYIAFTL